MLISNTPPEEGIIVNSSMSFLCSFNSFSAKATALLIYPHEVQYSILILLIIILLKISVHIIYPVRAYYKQNLCNLSLLLFS